MEGLFIVCLFPRMLQLYWGFSSSAGLCPSRMAWSQGSPEVPGLHQLVEASPKTAELDLPSVA